MSARLRLSVVLCTYNGANFLPEQINSLLTQNRLPDEIVIGDDSSTDETFTILQVFKIQAERLGVQIHLHRNPINLGFVANFEMIMQLATGDVVFLCDQDDIWHADKLESMEARFAAEPDLLLLHTDARLVDAQCRDLGSGLFEVLELGMDELRMIHAGRAFDVLLRRSVVTGATAAVRRAWLTQLLPVGLGWFHDEWLAVVAAALGRVDAIEAPLIYYRQHAGNQIGARRRTFRDKWIDLVRPRRAFFSQEVDRMQVLAAHLSRLDLSVDKPVMKMLKNRHDYLMSRIAIGKLPRLYRIKPVMAEARSGAYSQHGTGFRSLLRDLLRHD